MIFKYLAGKPPFPIKFWNEDLWTIQRPDSLLKLGNANHCYEKCIGGIPWGRPLVSAPDSAPAQ